MFIDPTSPVVRFCTDEAGTTSVSWVALTAGCLGLLLAAMAIVSGGVETLTTDTMEIAANVDMTAGQGDAGVITTD